MDILNFIKGKTFDAEELLDQLRKSDVSTYWQPGSFRDMRGIKWYRNNEVDDMPSPDEPIPFFVSTNPEFVTGMRFDGVQVEDYLALNELDSNGVVKVYPVDFEPALPFLFRDGAFTEDFRVSNWMGDDHIIDYANSYLVEFHLNETYIYDDFENVDPKTYKVARNAKDHLGVDVPVKDLRLDVTGVRKYFRLCVACGNWSFLHYCLQNRIFFDQIHPLFTNVPFQECDSVMRHFFPLISDEIVVDRDLQGEIGLFDREIWDDEQYFLNKLSELFTPIMRYDLELLDGWIYDEYADELRKMYKYRILK